MSGFAIEQIQEQMRQLKLVRTAELLPLLLQDASKGEVAYSEFLAELFGRELAAKQERHTAMKTTMIASLMATAMLLTRTEVCIPRESIAVIRRTIRIATRLR